MTKDCANCGKDAILAMAELTMKLEESQEYVAILLRSLRAAEAMCHFLQDKNETLENKIDVYIKHIENKKLKNECKGEDK